MDLTRLQPLPFQVRLRDHLKSTEAEVWDWFASGKVRTEHFQAARLDLLRSSFRIDRESQPAMYQVAEQAASKLGLAYPITLYQAQQVDNKLNAGLVWIPEEAHVVLHGPVADRLTEGELLSVFGHELAHAVLWSHSGGRYHTLDRIINSLAADAQAGPVHGRTLQLFNLYAEIFCDRGAVVACGDLEVAISALIKVNSGSDDINAKSFLKQAEEVLTADPTPSAGHSHPETVIRARCLQLWCDEADDVEEQVAQLIEGKLALSQLHLLQQVELSALTRKLVVHLLGPKWMRTELNLAHARMFFEDGRLPPPDKSVGPWTMTVDDFDPQLCEYFCYVLLDFVTADADLREQSLAHMYLVAREMHLDERFLETVRKELNLRKRQTDALRNDAEQIVSKAQALAVERVG